jgi:hypothetical protein
MSKIFYKLDIKIDLAKAREYYLTLQRDYAHKKWTASVGDVEICGWAIHGVKGKTGNFGLYEKDGEPRGVEHYFETELAFGWAKDMLELFPMGYRAGVGSSPAGTIVPAHVDECRDFAYRLHIPIYTNDKYIWTTPEGQFHMPAGSVYMVDTAFEHATHNGGDEARVHFGIAIPKVYFKDLEHLVI